MKSKVKKTSWLLGLAWLGFFNGLGAQVVQTNYAPASQFAVMPGDEVSPRVAAMGEAFVAVADDASAVLSNPAGLASLGKGEVGLLSRLGWVGSFQETALFALPMGKWGGLGLAGSYFSYGTLDGHDSTGNSTPGYSADAMAFHAGWGTPLLDELSVGLALHGFQQSIAGTGYSSFLPSVGLLAGPFGSMRLGLSYEDLGASSWNGPQLSVVEAGASLKSELVPSTFFLAAMEGDFQSDSANHLKLGLEFTYQSQFFLRCGYQLDSTGNGYSGFSVGAGFALKGFALDYAYLPYSDLGDNHRISLTYFFEALGKDTAVASAIKAKPGTDVPGSRVAVGPSASKANASIQSGTGGGTDLKIPAANSASSKTTAGGQPGPTGENTSLPAVQGSALDSSQPQPPPIQSAQGGAVTTKENADSTGDKDSLTLQFDIPPDYVAKGDQFVSQGRYADAGLAYQKAIQQDSQNVRAWYALGRLYYMANQKDASIQCFEKALALRPDNAALKDWLQKYKAQQP